MACWIPDAQQLLEQKKTPGGTSISFNQRAAALGLYFTGVGCLRKGQKRRIIYQLSGILLSTVTKAIYDLYVHSPDYATTLIE